MKRNTQTESLIKQSLLVLINEKKNINISVVELCKKAGINRSTFYLHYQDINNVILEIENEFLNQVETYIKETSIIPEVNTFKSIYLVLDYLKQNKDLSFALLNNNLNSEFSIRLFSIPKIQDLLSLALSSFQQDEREYVTSFIINGAYALIIKWVNNNFDLSTERITKLTLELTNSVRK